MRSRPYVQGRPVNGFSCRATVKSERMLACYVLFKFTVDLIGRQGRHIWVAPGMGLDKRRVVHLSAPWEAPCYETG